MKKNIGITLIALVVTIIVLIIIAGIGINLIINSDLFTKAKESRTNYQLSANEEKANLDKLFGQLQLAADGTVTIDMTTLNEYIESKINDILSSSGIVEDKINDAVSSGGVIESKINDEISSNGVIESKINEAVSQKNLVSSTQVSNTVSTAISTNNLNKIYPVGSIFMSTSSTNPGTYLGGTWVAWGTGRVPVGIDTSQTEFNSIEKTGGAKTQAITIDQLPRIQQTIGLHAAVSSFDNEARGITGSGTGITESTYSALFRTDNNTSVANRSVNKSLQIDYGKNQAHNNLQPYITCYMWKRTA